MLDFSNSFLPALAVLILSYNPVNAADPTIGPLAPISIATESAYSLARGCAAGCLVDNSVFPCGFAGHQDLGVNLGCSCVPTNHCYCNEESQDQVTSYISSCVKAGCSKFGNLENDLSGIFGLYDGYCATANVALSTSTKSTAAKTTVPGAAVQTTVEGLPESTFTTAKETGNPASQTNSPTGQAKEDEGLSKSDIIALGTGLGIGVPSLLVGIIALVIQMRKRKATAEHGILIPTESYQHINPIVPAPTPTPPPIHGYGQGQSYELSTHDTQRWR